MGLGLLKNIFSSPKKEEESAALDKIKVVVVAFDDNCLTNSGQILSEYLEANSLLDVCYYDEPMDKKFLNLESRNFFDFIDNGKRILRKTKSDVLIWGYRSQEKIRLNFQILNQYENQTVPVFSILNELYLPLFYFQDRKILPSILDLIFATILTIINNDKYSSALGQTVNKINNSAPPHDLDVSYMPYILNLLALTYLNSVKDNVTKKDVKIVSQILKNAVSYPQKDVKSVLSGLVYANFGQLYQLASEFSADGKYENIKLAIDCYTHSQKYFNRQIFPYDFGGIAYRLSKLYFSCWKHAADIQLLRDAIFHLREAQKVFTQMLFPKMWAEIQKDLGLYLSMMGVFARSDEVSMIAVENFKNYQKIYNKNNSPYEYAKAQENIGNIFFECGKIYGNEEYFEEACKYYLDAADIYEDIKKFSEYDKMQICVIKADEHILRLSKD